MMEERKEAVEDKNDFKFDVDEMHHLVIRGHSDLRNQIIEFLHQPLYHPHFHKDLNLYEQKDFNQKRFECITKQKFISIFDVQIDLRKYFAFFESLVVPDFALPLSLNSHYNLYAMSVLNLGTEKHHKKYLNRVNNLDILGAYAMSELGHGSNVQRIETTATYNAKTKEFILHTPSESAEKFWVCNLTRAKSLVVFARLFVFDVDHGVHPFVVDLYDANDALIDGVKIREEGKLSSVQSLSIGRIKFHNARIDMDSLLDRYAQVSKAGVYTSILDDESKRIAYFFNEVTIFNLVLAISGLTNSRIGLCIAIHYAFSKKQFGPDEQGERFLMSYPLHHRRLIPHLATNYALSIFIEGCKDQYISKSSKSMKELKILATIAKAFASFHARDCLQACRECCGAQGFMADNIVGYLRCESDALFSIYGDNYVMMFEVANYALSHFVARYKQAKGLFRYTGKWIKNALESNPLTKRTTDSVHLRDISFLTRAFTYKEFRLVESLAQSLQDKISEGIEGFDAWQNCGVDIVKVGMTVGHRIVLDHLAATMENLSENSSLKMVLSNIAALYGLERIIEDGFFVEEGYISQNKYSAINNEINLLCTELASQSKELIQAWNLPHWIFQHTIAQSCL